MKQKSTPKSKSQKKTKTYNGGKIRVTNYGTYAADVHIGGTRKRKSCESLDDAKAFIDDAVGESIRIGTAIFPKLSPKEAQDAVEAIHILKQAGKTESLYHIVQTHLDRGNGPGPNTTIQEPFEAHVEDLRQRRRRRTWEDKENRLKGFVKLHGDERLSDVTFQNIQEWLDSTGHSGRTLRNDQIAIQSFFNWCDQCDVPPENWTGLTYGVNFLRALRSHPLYQ